MDLEHDTKRKLSHLKYTVPNKLSRPTYYLCHQNNLTTSSPYHQPGKLGLLIHRQKEKTSCLDKEFPSQKDSFYILHCSSMLHLFKIIIIQNKYHAIFILFTDLHVTIQDNPLQKPKQWILFMKVIFYSLHVTPLFLQFIICRRCMQSQK